MEAVGKREIYKQAANISRKNTRSKGYSRKGATNP